LTIEEKKEVFSPVKARERCNVRPRGKRGKHKIKGGEGGIREGKIIHQFSTKGRPRGWGKREVVTVP